MNNQCQLLSTMKKHLNNSFLNSILKSNQKIKYMGNHKFTIPRRIMKIKRNPGKYRVMRLVWIIMS